MNKEESRKYRRKTFEKDTNEVNQQTGHGRLYQSRHYSHYKARLVHETHAYCKKFTGVIRNIDDHN
eukprot:16139326-Heterocapsa_arctica.AAC.1